MCKMAWLSFVCNHVWQWVKHGYHVYACMCGYGWNMSSGAPIPGTHVSDCNLNMHIRQFAGIQTYLLGLQHPALDLHDDYRS